MSEISEIPMTEQEVGTTKLRPEFPPIPIPKKITERDIATAVKDVARKAEMGREISLKQPEPTLTPAAGDSIKSADATTLKRLTNNALRIASEALRFSVDKVPLTASAVSFLLSISCGNVERQSVPPATSVPAISEIPGGMPSATAVSEHLVTATPETPPISTPTPTPEPTSTPSIPTLTENATIQKENKELIPYSPSITIIDAAPSVPTEGLIQKEFISNDEMIRNMLGDKYVSKEQIIQDFGQNYEEKWDEVVEKYPQALTYRLVDQYFNHGEKVTRVMESTLERSGLQSTGVNILPIQGILDKDSVSFIKDSSGSPGISLNFDPNLIIKLLANDPNRVVINGSFQVGKVELFQVTKKYTEVIPKYDPDDPRFSESGYFLDDGKTFYQGAVESRQNSDGSVDYLDAEGKKVNPISWEEFEKRKLENSEVKEYKSTELEIHGAYAKEKAMENLPKLFAACNAYPNKFFVFAGGNTGEDFREAMETLKDKIPKNLLIVAEWIKYDGTYKYDGPAMEYGKYGPVYGPDIYVYNKGSKHPSGSSFSVPELSAEIEVLLKKGLSFKQAKEKILASSDVYTRTLEDGTEATLRVFNPSKMQEK